ERDVAVTGAEFEGVPREVFRVHAGQRVVFGQRIRGARAYVAVSRGIETPKVLGSRATHVPSEMGGVEGRALKAGDELPLGRPIGGERRYETRYETFVASGFSRTLTATLTPTPTSLRVLPGPQLDRFTASAMDTLQSAPYRIGTDSNRMGYRLTGPRLEHSRGADIISDATPLGSLQVPASGQPILLMADRQTTGGYAKIATVIAADIRLAGQLAPGDEIRFAVCTP